MVVTGEVSVDAGAGSVIGAGAGVGSEAGAGSVIGVGSGAGAGSSVGAVVVVSVDGVVVEVSAGTVVSAGTGSDFNFDFPLVSDGAGEPHTPAVLTTAPDFTFRQNGSPVSSS